MATNERSQAKINYNPPNFLLAMNTTTTGISISNPTTTIITTITMTTTTMTTTITTATRMILRLVSFLSDVKQQFGRRS